MHLVPMRTPTQLLYKPNTHLSSRMDYGIANSLALHTIRRGSCFWNYMRVCVEIYDSGKPISEALCYWRNNKMCVQLCVCVYRGGIFQVDHGCMQ